MSEHGDDLDEDAKDLDVVEADVDKAEDEMLDERHKSEHGSLAEEQSADMSEEEAFEQSQTDVRQKIHTETAEESASEEESAHSETGKDTKIVAKSSSHKIIATSSSQKIKATSSGQRIGGTEHEEISRSTSKTKIEAGLKTEEEEKEERGDDEEDETEDEMEEPEDGEEDGAETQLKGEIKPRVVSREILAQTSRDMLSQSSKETLSQTSLLSEQLEEEEAEEEEEEDEDEVEKEEALRAKKRHQLQHDYNAAKAEQKRLQDLNRKLQHRLYAQLKRNEHELTVQTEEELQELEQQYITSMGELHELHRDQEHLEKNQAREMETLTQESLDHRALADTYLTKLLNYRKYTMTGGNKNRKSSRYIRAEQYAQTEREKWIEASKVTLENIFIKEEYDSIAKILRDREKVAEGLTMADFEQLKIENQSCNEKIEEKNETITMVRRKLREAVQRFTHVKQKLHFIHIKTRDERADLAEVEDRVSVRRQILSETKMARDRLKRDSKMLRQKSALLCFPDLLRDYEKKLDETDALRVQVAELRISHKDMTMEIRKLRRKMDELKSIAETTGEKY